MIKYMKTMNFKNVGMPKDDTPKLLALALVLMLVLLLIGFLTVSRVGEIFVGGGGGALELEPGQSSAGDVINNLGEPDAIEEIEGGEAYIYDSLNDFTDVVVVKDNKVESAQQNIFNDELGLVSDYIEQYGDPSLTLFDGSDPQIRWLIFSKNGVGVGTLDNEQVMKIIKFEAKSDDEFLQTTAKTYNLLEQDKVSELSDFNELGHEVRAPQ